MARIPLRLLCFRFLDVSLFSTSVQTDEKKHRQAGEISDVCLKRSDDYNKVMSGIWIWSRKGCSRQEPVAVMQGMFLIVSAYLSSPRFIFGSLNNDNDFTASPFPH
ncbi:hypothetical protein DNTS_024006 [Danionella cerebrum]|uniref:Secreted protein n=1 Tax=Danionella cerebrum TaxID=2873325 RepID=A0A553MVB1_9TELE|nr:hypothetical protein DNTS_024006 [Danionella translucida]